MAKTSQPSPRKAGAAARPAAKRAGNDVITTPPHEAAPQARPEREPRHEAAPRPPLALSIDANEARAPLRASEPPGEASAPSKAPAGAARPATERPEEAAPSREAPADAPRDIKPVEQAARGAAQAAPTSSVSSEGPERAALPLGAGRSAGQAWLEGSARLREEMLTYARTQIEDGLATGRAIWTCGSLDAALELQSRYVAKSMENGLQHAWTLVQLSSDVVRATLANRDPG